MADNIIQTLESIKVQLSLLPQELFTQIAKMENASVEKRLEVVFACKTDVANINTIAESMLNSIKQLSKGEEIEVALPTSLFDSDDGMVTDIGSVTEHSLDEGNFEYKKPYGFKLKDEVYRELNSWASIYSRFIDLLSEMDMDKWKRLLDTSPRYSGYPGINARWVVNRIIELLPHFNQEVDQFNILLLNVPDRQKRVMNRKYGGLVTSHSLDEDFRFKSPVGFKINDKEYRALRTWDLLYRGFLDVLRGLNRDKYKEVLATGQKWREPNHSDSNNVASKIKRLLPHFNQEVDQFRILCLNIPNKQRRNHFVLPDREK